MSKKPHSPAEPVLFDDEDDAIAESVRHPDAVVVDGPEDGQWTVMDVRAAIDADLLYRWTGLRKNFWVGKVSYLSGRASSS